MVELSHTGVDVIDFILFTIYPVIALFAVEMASRIIGRIIKIPTGLKLSVQGIISIGFAITYMTFPGDTKFPLTAAVLIALSISLFYQARRAKISPEKTMY